MFLFYNLFHMNAYSEQSFGARLLRAEELLQHIKTFSNYNPPHTEDSTASIANLLADINEANDKETDEEIAYRDIIEARREAYWTGKESVKKLLSPLRAAVQTQYTKHSPEYEHVLNHIRKLRNHQGLSKKTTVTSEAEGANGGAAGNGAGENATEEAVDDTSISHSEQSFGSLHRHFADLVLELKKFQNYNPDNAALKMLALENRVTALYAMNNEAYSHFTALRDQRLERRNLYKELEKRVQSIKAYVLATYGIESNEYATIKGIEV
jgi:hypothetical protein